MQYRVDLRELSPTNNSYARRSALWPFLFLIVPIRCVYQSLYYFSRHNLICAKRSESRLGTGDYQQARFIGTYNDSCGRCCFTISIFSCHSPFNDISHSLAYGRPNSSCIPKYCVSSSIFEKYDYKDATYGSWICDFGSS